MSEASLKTQILDWFFRQEFPSGVLEFNSLLSLAATSALKMDDIDAEQFVAANSKRYWNDVKQEMDVCTSKGLSPLFVVKDELTRRISWFAKDLSVISATKDKHRAAMLCSRPHLLSAIDKLDDRAFEALGCVACRLLGAQNVLLTRKGNEGGIDFFASIVLPPRSHVLFGSTGPLRIVGQSKKYTSKVQVDTIRGFITTLNDIKHQSPHLSDLVPPWFSTGRGPIIGWVIAHSGFQAGAVSTAQNHGIILSDSRDIAEIAALSRILNISLAPNACVDTLNQKVQLDLGEE